jgi:diguanylate cyclase (GGDEF)-like protein/PAS domain S-box-containing protein
MASGSDGTIVHLVTNPSALPSTGLTAAVPGASAAAWVAVAVAIVSVVCASVALWIVIRMTSGATSGVTAPDDDAVTGPPDVSTPGPKTFSTSDIPFETLVEHCADVLLVVDGEARVRYANPALDTVFGYPHRMIVGQPFSALVTDGCAEAVEARIAVGLDMGAGESASFEVEMLAGDQSIRPAQVVMMTCRDEVEGPCLVLTMTDITAFRSVEAQLEHQAFHDPLTGLPNRGLFLNRLEQAMRRRARDDGHVALLYLDLDGFKAINDTRGHDAGDELLQAVGYRLVGCLRTGDTVARMGGDEFAVLMDDGATVDDAKAVAQRILEVLSLPLDVAGEPIAVQASVGLALGGAGATSESLLRSADLAMLRAKQAGKAQVSIDETSADGA